MAFKIVKEELGICGNNPVITAVLDSADDLEDLEASGVYGTNSLAYIADNSGVSYIVNASGEWVAFTPTGSVGGA